MSDTSTECSPSRRSRISDFAEIASIVVLFFIVGGTPAPEINEAQYLSKARHFWIPDWCGPDHFLNSANTHFVFYVAFGWLTQFLSLPATAWVGRLLGWTLLAWSWQRVARHFNAQFGMAFISAGLWLFLIRKFNMAGEWVVGGIEAKIFAYVFVFLGIEALIQSRWNRVWVFFGIASAFHVLVGGWSVVAAAIAYAIGLRSKEFDVSDLFPGLIIGGIVSLAGVLPVFLGAPEVSPADAAKGIEQYVFYRLRHHLIPRDFPVRFIVRYLFLTAVWSVAAYRMRGNKESRQMSTFVIGGLAIAVTGAMIDVLVGHMRPLASQLLRFYWFRLSDVVVPLGCALLYCRSVADLRRNARQPWLVAAGLAYVVVSASLVFFHQRQSDYPNCDKQGRVSSVAHYHSWMEVCDWIRLHTDDEEIVFAPPNHQSFKWNAQRAEIVTWKDVPQDPAGILEWRARLREIRIFLYRGKTRPVEYTNNALKELAKKYQFRFAIIERHRAIPRLFHRVPFENNDYIVYEVEQ